jgi:Zn-dependent protease
MNDTGWSLEGPTHTSLDQGALVLSGIGQDTVVRYRHFPSGIEDWRAETKSKWTGGGGGVADVNVVTEEGSYSWWLDGYYSQYIFSVGGEKVIQTPGPALQLDQWYVMTMVKTGNTFQLYVDGSLITSYVSQTPIGQALGMDNIAPWQGVQEYDYFSFQSAPALNWQFTFGGTSSDVASSAAMTTDGGYVLCGVTSSFGAGAFDSYLVKIDGNGTIVWNRTYGTSAGDWTYGVDPTSDGGFIICGATSNATTGTYDLWLIKVDLNGIEEWNKQYGFGVRGAGFDAIQTSDGGYAAIGYKQKAVGADDDVNLLKTDADGNIIWERTYGGTGADWGKVVIQTSDGGFGISGWTKSFGGTTRGYLIKTDASGTLEWEKDLGGSGLTYGYGIAETSEGGLILCGYTNSIGNGANDTYVACTGAAGNLLWEKAYGGSGEESGGSVFVLEDGLVIGGHSASFDPVYNKIFLVRTDLEGNVLWSGAYGPDVNVSGSIGALTSEDDMLIVGNTNQYNSGIDDVYVLRIGNSSVPIPPLPEPEPEVEEFNIMTQATMPVAAVAVGTGLSLLGLALASKAGEMSGAFSSKISSPLDRALDRLKEERSVKEAGDFSYGYAKGRLKSRLFKLLAKVEPEKMVAVQRQPFLAGFSSMELAVITATSVLMGLAFMMANQINWMDPALFLTYIVVAGIAVIMSDLANRYMAMKYGAVTEYKFWFLGTAIMFITAFFFKVVYAMPARLAINDADKMSQSKQAILASTGPLVNFGLFAAFMLLVPLGGFAATIGLVGASMNLLSAVYGLMPLKPMNGYKVLKWKWYVWAGMFLPMLALYFFMTLYVF